MPESLDNQDLLPDEVVSRHFADTSDEADWPPVPAAESESPDAEAEDTPDDPEDEESEDTRSGPDGEGEDTDDEEAGGEEEPAESREEEKTAPAGADDDFLPEFDRKTIESDPRLRAAYAHMRAAFTRKMQELGEKARRAEYLEREFREFEAQLRDEKGAEEFLVQVALARPEVFERAYERAARLAENPQERELFEREQRLREQERLAQRREQEHLVERIRARAEEISRTIARFGKEEGLEGEDFDLVERLVVEKIHENRVRTGISDVTDQDIKEAVLTAKRFLRRREEKAERAVSAKIAQERDAQVRAKVQAAKRPAPPRTSTAPGLRPKKLGPPPDGVDPLDHALDSLLGLKH